MINKYSGCIAIDLGTTNSVAYVADAHGKEEVIRNKEGEILTPSFVWFSIDDMTNKVRYRVGSLAKEKMKEDPENVVCSYKPLMGDSKATIKNVFGHRLTAEHCSALVLKYIKNCAEEQTGNIIEDAVITVPAYFTDVQKEATRHAAKQAGLNVLRLAAEPTAAAYHYNKANLKDGQEVKTILAYDLGGGTFDISLINICADGSAQVIGVGGDPHLGGDNIDVAMAKFIATKSNILPKGSNFTDLDINLQEKLIRIGETAKIALSKEHYIKDNYSTNVKVNDIVDENKYPDVKNIKITAREFKSVLLPIVETTIDKLNQTITENNVDVMSIDEVLLVGGSTRLPYIRECLIEYLRGFYDNPDDCKYTMDYFDDYIIDPDQAVARGAFLIMKDVVDKNDNNLVDVIPQPIGVKMFDGSMNTIIRKGSPLPVTGRLTVSNQFIGQTEMLIEIYQGINKMATNNELLGTINVPIKAALGKGAETVTVKIAVDKKGDIKATVIGATRISIKISRYFDNDNATVDEIIDDMSDNAKPKEPHNTSKKKTSKEIKSVGFGEE